MNDLLVFLQYHLLLAFSVKRVLILIIERHVCRFFKHLLLVFLTQQMAAGLFRLIAGVCRTMIIANTGGVLILLLIFLLGGFIIPKGLHATKSLNVQTLDKKTRAILLSY